LSVSSKNLKAESTENSRNGDLRQGFRRLGDINALGGDSEPPKGICGAVSRMAKGARKAAE
jgi:hypothetical protein